MNSAPAVESETVPQEGEGQKPYSSERPGQWEPGNPHDTARGRPKMERNSVGLPGPRGGSELHRGRSSGDP
jgi:hypothetical protein